MDTAQIGARIRAVRLAKGLSGAQAARATNLSRSQISKFECNRTVPTIQVLQKLADGFEIKLCDLIDPNSTLDSSGPQLSDADRQYLLEIHRLTSVLTVQQRNGLIQKVRYLARTAVSQRSREVRS